MRIKRWKDEQSAFKGWKATINPVPEIHITTSPTPIFFAKLTMPPSSNMIFPGKAHRYKSKEYKDWIKANEWACLFKVKTIEEPCEVWIRLGLSNKQMGSDCANREKPITDLLVHCKVLKNDSAKYVKGNHQVVDASVPEGYAIVEVRKA